MRWIIICFLVGASVALAQDTKGPEYRQAMNNLAHEHIECVAYNIFVSACLVKDGTTALAERYSKTSATLLERATLFSAEAQLLPETVGARLEIAMAEQEKAVAKNCGNLSILLAKYANKCKVLAENPSARGAELLQAELSRSLKQQKK